MLKEERFDHILEALKEKEKVTYETLATDLKVSEDTIRRDIDFLHHNGMLSKVRGGAILLSKNPLNFQDRTSHLSEGKQVIALKAQQFIKSGMTVFMDGGTTNCTIAAHLPVDANFRIVTNNMALIPVLSRFKNIELILLGGAYNRDTETNLGAKTCEEIGNYIADIYFLGACAIQQQFGVTAAFAEEAATKQAMLNAAKQTIVLGNIEKLNSTEPFKVCGLETISILITDLPGNDEQLNPYRNNGFKIV